MKTGIIFVPGVGRSEKAEKNCKIMAERLGHDYVIVNWQKEVELMADPLIETHCSYGSWLAKKLRKLFYDVAFDGSSYESFRDTAIDQLRNTYIDMASKHDRIILISFSWGTVISYDFLNEYITPSITDFVTLASPLPFAKPRGYTSLTSKNWLNFWEKSDVIGHQLFKPGIKDIEINTGLKGVSPLSHISYLKSKKCARIIKRELEL